MKVSWDDEIPNIWKVIKFHGSKPPTSWGILFLLVPSDLHGILPRLLGRAPWRNRCRRRRGDPPPPVSARWSLPWNPGSPDPTDFWMANEKYQSVGIIVPNIWKNIKKNPSYQPGNRMGDVRKRYYVQYTCKAVLQLGYMDCYLFLQKENQDQSLDL